ncbi:hypothetical protein Tco_1058290 [Tanacetum coccineum]|uniref:Reverse transcriptase domain-containing protein n=1 Tax=Tanacetum coccineum TaxID=301880 RepID=A0ABQ5H9Y4_9ASTR
MVRTVTDREIKNAMFSMGDDKSPGPDGYTAAFFKEAWEIVGDDIIKAIRELSLRDERLLKELNHTIIALLPKAASLSSGSAFGLFSAHAERIEYGLIEKFKTVFLFMRTRSQSRRRRQQQAPPVVVENFDLEEPIVDQNIVAMADNRTMAQMLQAPIEGYEDAIVVPPINANNFELKQPLINLVQSNKFTGRQDPHNHLRFFNKVTSTYKYNTNKVFQSASKAEDVFSVLLVLKLVLQLGSSVSLLVQEPL